MTFVSSPLLATKPTLATTPPQRMYPADALIYQNIFDAKEAGAITRLGAVGYNDTSHKTSPWNGRPLIRFGGNNDPDGTGAKVVVPAGYDTLWLRVLGDRWNVIQAAFLDGDQEKIGRSGEIALTPKPQTNSNFWLSGLAFSRNPLGHAAQSAVGLHWAINGGDKAAWHSHNWYNDQLAYLPQSKAYKIQIPVLANGQDKCLYVIEHNNSGVGAMHGPIKVNGQLTQRLLSTWDNPFARHWNSKPYQRYIAVRIPAGFIPEGAHFLEVEFDQRPVNERFYFREMGTHNA